MIMTQTIVEAGLEGISFLKLDFSHLQHIRPLMPILTFLVKEQVSLHTVQAEKISQKA